MAGRRRSHLKKLKPKQAAVLLASVLAVLLALAGILYLFGGAPGQKPAEPVHTLPKNDFVPENFKLVNGRMHYTGAYRQGIDISEHQDKIDWNAVAEDGISFAMLRLGYRGTTEGGLFRDDRFEEHLEGAKGVGIEVGAYFFSQATTVDEAIQEAELALEILDGRKLTYPVMYDWEIAYEGRTADVPYATVTACTLAFCKRIEEGGYRAGTYFNLEMAKFMRMVELEDYVRWIADYHESPRWDYTFTFWQYTDQGHVSGIEGIVDMNLMFVEPPKPEPTEPTQLDEK